MLSSKTNVADLVTAINPKGFLGKAGGEPAFAYARVSTDEQAEGGAGLDRQLRHIDNVAYDKNLYIPLEMIYLDDHTGFEFRDRPALLLLRKAYMQPKRQSSYVVMEYLDRLSRNADWHQGYLLDEMKQYGVRALFWKQYGSRVEQAVMGAIAQDGMEQARERMRDGNYKKARDGRIPARKPAYGYIFVASRGEPGAAARKDTHYAINPEEASVVKSIYEQIAYHGRSLRWVANNLQERNVKPPRAAILWDHAYVKALVSNPLYKGEFVYGRTRLEKVTTTNGTSLLTSARTVTRRVSTPKDNWVIVPVPAIVTHELWEAANIAIPKNKATAKRNGKRNYLLTSLLRCTCGYVYTGFGVARNEKIYYRCGSAVLVQARKAKCDQRIISGEFIEGAIWGIVRDLLIEPSMILKSLDDLLIDDVNTELKSQAAFLQQQLENLENDDTRLWRAYKAGAFDADEFAAERATIKKAKAATQQELASVENQIVTQEDINQRKQTLIEISEQARELGLDGDLDFHVKKTIVRTIINEIGLDVNGGRFTISGIITGAWSFGDVEPNSATTNCGNSRERSVS